MGQSRVQYRPDTIEHQSKPHKLIWTSFLSAWRLLKFNYIYKHIRFKTLQLISKLCMNSDWMPYGHKMNANESYMGSVSSLDLRCNDSFWVWTVCKFKLWPLINHLDIYKVTVVMYCKSLILHEYLFPQINTVNMVHVLKLEI